MIFPIGAPSSPSIVSDEAERLQARYGSGARRTITPEAGSERRTFGAVIEHSCTTALGAVHSHLGGPDAWFEYTTPDGRPLFWVSAASQEAILSTGMRVRRDQGTAPGGFRRDALIGARTQWFGPTLHKTRISAFRLKRTQAAIAVVFRRPCRITALRCRHASLTFGYRLVGYAAAGVVATSSFRGCRSVS